jgi:hypothetical protein
MTHSHTHKEKLKTFFHLLSFDSIYGNILWLNDSATRKKKRKKMREKLFLFKYNFEFQIKNELSNF